MSDRVLAPLLTVAFFLSALVSTPVAAECLGYGAVELTGRLVQQTYAGPPDYKSVPDDQPLVIWVLQLIRSVCIARSGSGYPGSYGTREIQVVFGGDQYAGGNEYTPYRPLLGRKITVMGRLVPGAARYKKRFVIVASAVQPISDSRRSLDTGRQYPTS